MIFQCRATFLARLLSLLCIAGWLSDQGKSVQAQTKLALLVGVEKYERDGFEPLHFAEDDALELKIELEKIGFKTAAIVGKDATLVGLEKGLSSLYASSKKLKRDDVVLVFLSGHGVQKLVRRTEDGKTVEKEEPFFCPIDAHKNDISTLLSMNDLLHRLEEDSGASNNVVLLDACRESTDKGVKGLDGSKIELPNKIALFFAAQSGHRSFESRTLKHGIFTHYLLEGLRGRAADEDNEITLQGLTNYVSKKVQRDSPGLLNVEESDAQQPNFMGNMRGSLLLGKVAAKPQEGKGKTISLIPPGQSFSASERQRRIDKGIKGLKLLNIKDAATNPSMAYVRGKLYGTQSLKFQLQNPSYEEVIKYIAELHSINRNVNNQEYETRAATLVSFLKAYEKFDGKLDIYGGKYWAIEFSPPRSSVIINAVENGMWRFLPSSIRSLMAMTTQDQLKRELSNTLWTDDDEAVRAALCGNYEEAIRARKFSTHGYAAVIPPTLLGDEEFSLRIANSFDYPNYRYTSLLFIGQTLLDDGKTEAAKRILSGLPAPSQGPMNTGYHPLPVFGFHSGVSTNSEPVEAHIFGRLDDEVRYKDLLEFVIAECMKHNHELNTDELRLAYLTGFVADL